MSRRTCRERSRARLSSPCSHWRDCGAGSVSSSSGRLILGRAADLIYAFYEGNRLGLEPGQLGAAYFIFTVIVPLLFIAHARFDSHARRETSDLLLILGIDDLKRSLRFYRNGLGLPTHRAQFEHGDVAFFEPRDRVPWRGTAEWLPRSSGMSRIGKRGQSLISRFTGHSSMLGTCHCSTWGTRGTTKAKARSTRYRRQGPGKLPSPSSAQLRCTRQLVPAFCNCVHNAFALSRPSVPMRTRNQDVPPDNLVSTNSGSRSARRAECFCLS